MDERLRRLILRTLARIGAAQDALRAGDTTPAQWADAMARALAEGHVAALRAGGADPARPAGRAVVTQTIATQLHFLRGFQAVIEAAPQFEAGWQARAASYAQSVGAPYWRGRTKLLPLPAVPKDGSTICKGNCGCAWDIQQIDGDGNYDCTWRRGKNDSCSTCIARERVWSPLRIRNGELV